MLKNQIIKLVSIICLLFMTSFIQLSAVGNDAMILFNSGVADLTMKNYDSAISYFQRTLKINPYHIKAYNNLGIALQKKNDYNNALLAYQQALKLDPRYGSAYYNMGLTLRDMGKTSESIEALQAFVNFNPTDSDAVRAKWIANDLRDSIPEISKQLRKYYLGCWLISDLSYKNAIPPLEESLSLKPDDIKIKYALGLAKKRTGDYQGAIEQFNSILQANNQNALAYYELAESYEKLGNMNAATQGYQAYMQLAPYSESGKALKSKLASMQQQVAASQQQNFYQNALTNQQGMNTTASNPVPYVNQGYSQQPAQPYQTQQQPVPNFQQPQQYIQPQTQQAYAPQQQIVPTPMNQTQPQGVIPGITAPPAYVNRGGGNPVVPQIGSYSYSGGYSGPTAGTPAARTGKTRIAILDFDYSAVRPWWTGKWDIGKGLASLIQGELVRSHVYSVIERTALDQILQEQKITQTSLFDQTTAANLGKLLGVDILVLGNITQFGIENKKKSIGAAIPIVSIVSGIQSKKSLARVTFDMRMVSVDTGEVLDVTTVTGKSKRRGMLIDFSKGGNAGAISFSSSNFQDSVLGEASTAASEKAVEIINSQYEKLTNATIDSTSQDVGVVAYVGVSGVIVNAGSNAGLKIGNVLSIERLIDVVKDPITGKVIKALTRPVAEIEIKEIEPSAATGKLISGSGAQVGDLVRFKPQMNVTAPGADAETSVSAEIMYKKKKKKR